MNCASLTPEQILALMGALAIALGLVIFWVAEWRAQAAVRRERAKRGLYADPASFVAIDEEFAYRRQRPIKPPPAPPRGPRT